MSTNTYLRTQTSTNANGCNNLLTYVHTVDAGVLVSFLELHFLGKMALLALRGRPQPLKKPSQSQKGHFYEKMNALNDTKTSELSKSAEGNGEYLWSSVAFVEAWIKSKSRNANTGLKTTQMLHKNKAWIYINFYVRLYFWPFIRMSSTFK